MNYRTVVTVLLGLFCFSEQLQAAPNFPKGTVMNNGHDRIVITIVADPIIDKDQVKFVLKRKTGMWWKAARIYKEGQEGDDNAKILQLKCADGQDGRELMEADQDCQLEDLNQDLLFELAGAGGLGRYDKKKTWKFNGGNLGGKLVTIDWQQDK